MEEINTISTAVIAFSSVIGVGSSSAYYLSQFKFGIKSVIFMVAIYILVMLLFTLWLRRKIR